MGKGARPLLPLDAPEPVDALLWPPPPSTADDTRPPETLRLWAGERKLGFNQYTLTLLIALAAAVWQVTFVIMLGVSHTLNVEHYTYWSLFGFTAFTLALALALLVRRGLLTFVLLWLLPPINGTVRLVAFGIVVIISLDAEAYIAGSVCEGGKTTIERLHTGDWLLHVLPSVIVDSVLVSGLLSEVRDVYRGRMSQWGRVRRALYAAYVELSPLPTLALYDLIFNAREVYSIEMSRTSLWLLALAFIIVVQLFFLMSFTLDKRHKKRLVPVDVSYVAAALALEHQQQAAVAEKNY